MLENNENRETFTSDTINDGTPHETFRPGEEKKKGGVWKVVLVIVVALLIGGVSGMAVYMATNNVMERFLADAKLQLGDDFSLEIHEFDNNGKEQPAMEAPEVKETAPATEKTRTFKQEGVAVRDVSPIVEEAMPAVVAITGTTEVQTYSNWFFNFNMMPETYETESSGSGIIIGEDDKELRIVTNNHVVEGTKELMVVFNDEKSVKAEVKGKDSDKDIAVIAVKKADMEPETLKQIRIATIGDTKNLKVGQGVIAIGNALGYGQSVTVGYVSALGRSLRAEGKDIENLIQIDAAINPGNSGGALLNMSGEVIGINSAKYSSTDVEGMGYAIDIATVLDQIDTFSNQEIREEVAEEEQGYIGIQGQNIDAQVAQMYDMPEGIYVYKILEDVPAQHSDLREKDIITRLDGQSVGSMEELKALLTRYKGGEKVKLTISRLVDSEYQEMEIEVELALKSKVESEAETEKQQE